MRRVKPGLNPRIENPTGLLAVISRQALELARSLELGPSRANAGECKLLDQRLSRLRNHRSTALRESAQPSL